MMGSPENQPQPFFSPDVQGGPPNPMMMYPIEGQALQREINRVTEIRELWPVALKSAAWMEGLKYGLTYDVSRTPHYLNAMGLFFTTETGSARPSTLYVGGSLEQKLQDAAFDNEGNAEKQAEVMDIANHLEARRLVDRAYIQRMMACNTEKDFSGLVSSDPLRNPAVTPDKGHWQAFFGSSENSPAHKWGMDVDKTMRAIVACGLADPERAGLDLKGYPPPSDWGISSEIYANGPKDRKAFETFFNYLRGASGNQMDVLWAAWRVSLTWEEISELGCISKEGIVENGKLKGDNLKIGAPPLVAALYAYLAHPDEKFRIEYGVRKDGSRKRDTKWISHSGYPWIATHAKEALGENYIVRSFLHQTTIKEDVIDPATGRIMKDRENKDMRKEVSLYDIWAKGKSFADPTFPWTETDQPLQGSDEVDSGAFSTWRLNIARGNGIVELMKWTPQVKEIAEPDFFINGDKEHSSPLRVTDKVLQDRAPEFRKHMLLNWLLPHHKVPIKDIRAGKENPDEDISYRPYGDDWSALRKELDEKDSKVPPSVNKILDNARQCGWIDQDAEKFIREQLSI